MKNALVNQWLAPADAPSAHEFPPSISGAAMMAPPEGVGELPPDLAEPPLEDTLTLLLTVFMFVEEEALRELLLEVEADDDVEEDVAVAGAVVTVGVVTAGVVDSVVFHACAGWLRTKAPARAKKIVLIGSRPHQVSVAKVYHNIATTRATSSVF